MSAADTIAAAREQGGLVGLPHPFDRMRGSMLRDESMAHIAGSVDWIETHNARLVGKGNEQAAEFALELGLPGVAVSDAHSIMEVGVAYVALDGDPSTPAGLLAALAGHIEIVPGRATFFVRLWTPLAKGVNRVRGNGRVAPAEVRRRPAGSRRRGMSGPDGQDLRPMAGEPDGSLGSEAMEATPALDASSRTHEPESLVDAIEHESTDVAQISIGQRLTQPRTILSIVVPLAIISFFLYLNRDRLAQVPTLILQANPALVLLAAAVFYLGFPLRGNRWQRLLRETGFIINLRNSTEILYISWFVNCVVPAKLGDVYRAYLLKMNSDASLSRTFGTVFIERILDIFAIAILALAAGFWSFRSGLPDAVRLLFIVGIVVVIVAAIGLFTMRNFGRRILLRLPLPARVLELYERFEEGVFGAVGLRHLPILVVITGLIWLTEGLRLYIVVLSFGFSDVEIGLSGAIFVALIGSLLDRDPAQPGRARVRAGRGDRRADRRVQDPAGRGDGDHDPRLGHQRPVDHRVRRDPVRRLADAARDGQDPAAAGAHDGRAGGLKTPFHGLFRARPDPPGAARRTIGQGVVPVHAQSGPAHTAPDRPAACAGPVTLLVPTGDTGARTPRR